MSSDLWVGYQLSPNTRGKQGHGIIHLMQENVLSTKNQCINLSTAELVNIHYCISIWTVYMLPNVKPIYYYHLQVYNDMIVNNKNK